jgi:DNA-directed RNA polymerase subunit RPC12/RpoP
MSSTGAAPTKKVSLEHMFETRCLDCPSDVSFAERPGEAVCPGCGLRLYVTASGQLGRYLADDWRPGGIQGYR